MQPAKKQQPLLSMDTSKVVYGYLLAEEPDELEIVAWQREIRHFCRTHGLVLANIFVDRGQLGDTVQRPGLAGLLDVLAMPETFGFVVPSEDHLSRSRHALIVLALRISQTQAQIVVMSQHTDDTSVWW
ncbi:recombinase family protein [Saccharothrix deserti]|uniref:recombinase family protein n=1 Tax=Saccharothrix deserti TaxID=2593674 RepID=UPI00131C5501|nr:recombinase family protein [Saccharothrix deserti]